MTRRSITAIALAAAATSAPLAAQQKQAAVEVVANLTGAMPTGTTVAPNGGTIRPSPSRS
jgi:hypothetical protein